ncbi:MAG: hypothetical protein A2X49_15000 [Lentisphaerae bacterium GWF2_52_8]|nr:MAG: hypothetical protein A2X49_15000 [Lentisphaerae bacterium GWF2_52_8]
MSWWHLYLGVVLIALSAALVLTPLCQKLAAITGFMDRPRCQAHKQHKAATPLLGGLALFAAWALTVAIGFLAPSIIDQVHLNRDVAGTLPGVMSVSTRMLFIFVGALMALSLGLYDDRYNMRAGTKLLGQIAIAAVAVTWGGVKITLFFSNPVFDWCATVFWFLLVMNSINFFDNMDGLAAGVAAIALSLFTIVAAANQQYFVAALGAAATGSVMGFWFYNHAPAAIFMGDAGSHFLGYILAVMSASVTYYQTGVSTTKFPVLIPLFILAIPLFDTAAVVVIRTLNRKPIYIGDNNHISHRFVRMGISRKGAVLLIHLLALTIGLSVLPLLWGDERTSIVSLVQACSLLLFVTVLQVLGAKATHPQDPAPSTAIPPMKP